jgi:hypothetical protein
MTVRREPWNVSFSGETVGRTGTDPSGCGTRRHVTEPHYFSTPGYPWTRAARSPQTSRYSRAGGAVLPVYGQPERRVNREPNTHASSAGSVKRAPPRARAGVYRNDFCSGAGTHRPSGRARRQSAPSCSAPAATPTSPATRSRSWRRGSWRSSLTDAAPTCSGSMVALRGTAELARLEIDILATTLLRTPRHPQAPSVRTAPTPQRKDHGEKSDGRRRVWREERQVAASRWLG